MVLRLRLRPAAARGIVAAARPLPLLQGHHMGDAPDQRDGLRGVGRHRRAGGFGRVSGHVHPDERDRPANGTTDTARAHETVAHGRAHLAYHRRLATVDVHRHNARMMRHEGNRTTG